jgi:hypothetical protein
VEKYNKDLERIRSKDQDCNRNRRGIGYLIRNLGFACAISASAVSCQSLKESTVVATGSAIGAGVGTAISGGVGAPILGAMTGAFVTDVATEVLTTNQETQTIINAPDNFFTLLEKIVGIGGWTLMLIFVVPMVLGWILPSPTKLNRKN